MTTGKRFIGPTLYCALGLVALSGTTALGCDKGTPAAGVAAKDPGSASASATASAPAMATAEPSASAASATATTTAVAADPVPSAAPSTSAGAKTAAVTPGADAGKPKTAGSAAVALKPVSKRITGSNFALDVATPGCRAGEDCAMTLKLVPQGEYHVNKEYPYKFIATPANGVAFLGKSDANTFTKAAGDYVEQGEKAATMTVRFKPAAAGEVHVSGKYKLSVCSAAQCQIEEQAIDLAVPVM